jgi:formamidopyrimidine-DNA glycosylase
MPELPEVETTLRGVAPYIVGQLIDNLTIHNGSLRWPVTQRISEITRGQRVVAITRRAKYLLVELERGTMMIHLGMSGSLRVVDRAAPRRKHDHIEMLMGNGACLRYHDPRRFGAWLWSDSGYPQRKMAVKPFIMDNRMVVGVGNIYASEALFRGGIRPDRSAGRVSLKRYEELADHIKEVLASAITQGGTTLRDFVNGNGEPGYFQQTLAVYGRGGQPCVSCAKTLKDIRLGQRSSVFCPACQR